MPSSFGTTSSNPFGKKNERIQFSSSFQVNKFNVCFWTSCRRFALFLGWVEFTSVSENEFFSDFFLARLFGYSFFFLGYIIGVQVYASNFLLT